ncbi:MAG: cytochrome b N-terminal domain-containing protein [Vampirovibrionales bacterium]|nr:cytochrome b N-terminal domain-containing protein [Vampirovibrionales bacterium]
MVTELLKTKLVLPLEYWTNKIVSQKYNPFYYHGALPNLFIWALFLSGLLLFAYYVPTLEKAYPSIRYITYTLDFGNAMRSVHRYAADGMMIFVVLHMLRVWLTDRFREYRILPWITGVILLSIIFIVGLTGYMLIWDQEAVSLTYITSNLLKSVPLIGHGLSSLLMGGELVTDYTLTRILFLHLAIPALMMFFLWMHYLRITRPVTTPPLALNVILIGALLAVAGLYPVELGIKPNLAQFTPNIELDLWYAWPQWLALQGWNFNVVMLLVLAVPVGLFVLPYLQKKLWRGQFAQVVKDNCTGCSLCYHDCPYEAIQMNERTDHPRFKKIAVVDPARCANCGLCVGACAFKAIEIPRRETTDVLAEIQETLKAASA